MPQASSADSAARVIRAILARPEYSVAARPQDPVRHWLGQLLEPVTRWIGRVIGALFSGIGGLGDRHGRAIAWGLGILALLVLGWVASHLLRTLQLSRAVNTAPAEASIPCQNTISWQARVQRAAALLARGDLRDAATELFAAVVARMNDRGDVLFAPSKTGADYKRELAIDIAPPFSRITDAYEQIVFGGEESAVTRSALLDSARGLGVDIDG